MNLKKFLGPKIAGSFHFNDVKNNKTKQKLSLSFQFRDKKFLSTSIYSPVISNPAVRCDVGEPANAIDPKVAPPSVPEKAKKTCKISSK